jgi:diadenosine tetraphosphatase ApaH/serine/threonine PP2A family protein phosphatase
VGRLDLDDFNNDARLANLQNREQLAPHNLAYLSSLPETLVAGEFTLVHGSPRHPIWEYMMDGRTALESLSHFDTPFCFVGHTHVPGVYGLDSANHQVQELALPPVAQLAMGFDRLIINPGSVGQPRDGDPRASYLVLDTGENSLIHGRVDYPYQLTQKKMVELGLPTRLATRLRHGW